MTNEINYQIQEGFNGEIYGWTLEMRNPNDIFTWSSYWNNRIYQTKKVWFHDRKYNYVSSLEVNTATKRVVSTDLCSERINFEHSQIDQLLRALSPQNCA